MLVYIVGTWCFLWRSVVAIGAGSCPCNELCQSSMEIGFHVLHILILVWLSSPLPLGLPRDFDKEFLNFCPSDIRLLSHPCTILRSEITLACRHRRASTSGQRESSSSGCSRSDSLKGTTRRHLVGPMVLHDERLVGLQGQRDVWLLQSAR